MKPHHLIIAFCLSLSACDKPAKEPSTSNTANTSTVSEAQSSNSEEFEWSPERFADIKIIRYQIPGFDELQLKQKELVYYLVQAGLAGRDIMWDQNYRHNLSIRRALEAILGGAQDSGPEWDALNTYARQVFFSNGIHHHYAGDKFTPAFTKAYFLDKLETVDGEISRDALQAMFDPSIDNKKVSQDSSGDLVKDSAINFYDPDITDRCRGHCFLSSDGTKAKRRQQTNLIRLK